MTIMSRLVPVIAVVAVVGVVFTAYSLMSTNVDAVTGDAPVVLHRGNSAEPSSLDPQRFTGTWANRIASDMFVGLYARDPAGDPVFGAATSHDVSEDGLTHTFTIREGHVWSDGVPVTAYDFEFAYRRMVDPQNAAEFASFHYIIENAREINFGEIDDLTQLGVHALDARTLEIKFVRPNPYADRLLVTYLFFPLPQHVVEAEGDNWVRAGTMVSNGAYVLANWVPNDHIRLERNPLFYDNDNVAIDTVYYYPTDDASSALRRFRAGEIDLNTDFPEQQFDWLMANIPDETRVSVSDSVGYIVINTEEPPFDDVRVRQALGMSIDREMIAESVLRIGEEPAYSIVSPLAPGYSVPRPDWAALPFPERQARARDLLAEAGFDAARPLRFTYRYRDSIKNRRAALAVANFWDQIGAEVDLVNTEVAIHYDDLRAGNFVVADAGWSALYPDPAEYLLLVHSDYAELNSPNYYNPEFDAPYNQALLELDLDRRNVLMAEAESIMLRDMPIIPTYYYVDKNLVGPQVQGWVDNTSNVHLTRYLSLDESLRPEQTNFVDQVMRWFN